MSLNPDAWVALATLVLCAAYTIYVIWRGTRGGGG